jgi:predicted PP-loop superfamily ATPase
MCSAENKSILMSLLYEAHKKYHYQKKFSIQRILRETRFNALEFGEALNLIWIFYKLK